MRNLTDVDPMPFGEHIGKPMQDVPVKYLHWVWHNIPRDINRPKQLAVLDYIERNLNALRMENSDLIWSK